MQAKESMRNELVKANMALHLGKLEEMSMRLQLVMDLLDGLMKDRNGIELAEKVRFVE